MSSVTRAETSTVEILAWDSAFFGFPIGRLHASSLSPDVLADADQWCRDNNVSCLYYLSDCPVDGFPCVDERVTYQWRPVLAPVRAPVPEHPSVRPFEPADLPHLEAIARVSHRDSRFYQDPRFDRHRCDDLYATWIRRDSQAAMNSTVFVATADNRPVGYISCTSNSIGLIAVAESAQGHGLGKQLVAAAQRHFQDRGVDHVEVITQGRNAAARNLYLKCGFRLSTTQHWYHLHV